MPKLEEEVLTKRAQVVISDFPDASLVNMLQKNMDVNIPREEEGIAESHALVCAALSHHDGVADAFLTPRDSAGVPLPPLSSTPSAATPKRRSGSSTSSSSPT